MSGKRSSGDRVETYARWVIRRRWPLLILTGIVWLAASFGAVFLKVNDDYRVFFEHDDPELEAYAALQNVYSKNEYIVFAVAPDSGEVFDSDTLEAIDHLTREAWKLPYSSRVDSLTNYPYSHADGDELIIEELVDDPENKSLEDLARLKEIALSEPEIVHSLISPSGHVAGVVVTYQLPDVAPVEGTEAALAARALAERITNGHPEIKVHLTGSLMLNNAFREAAENDISTLIPLMYVAIVLLSLVLFRSVVCTVVTMSVVALSVSTAMGVAGWLGFDITATSASAPNIIMTIAIADSVHLLIGLLEEIRNGRSKHDALIQSLRANIFPVFLTSFTTCIGFLSINFSESPPFRDLGNMCAMGIAAAFVYSVVFLPALLAVLPISASRQGVRTTAALKTLAEFVIRHRRVLLPGFTTVIILLAVLIPLNELNDHYTMYFNESNDFRKDIEFTTANLTGMYPIEYSISAEEEGGIAAPEYLTKLDEFAQWFRNQPKVIHVSSFSDVMKRINMNMHSDDPDQYTLPDNRELAAQYLFLYEMSLPFGLDLNNRVDVRKSSTRFIVTVGGVTANEVVLAAESGERWLDDNAPATMHAQGLGPGVLFSRIAQRDTRNMLIGTSTALVLVSVVFFLFLRNIKIGLISLIPNLVPAVMAFGVWGVCVGRIGLGLAAVIAVTLGIVVDDTIHFLTKYAQARREQNASAEDAVRYAFMSVGDALIVTSVILVGGFMVLSLSSFEVNAAMGRLTALVITFALVCDFVLLPCLLIAFDRTVPIDGGNEL